MGEGRSFLVRFSGTAGFLTGKEIRAGEMAALSVFRQSVGDRMVTYVFLKRRKGLGENRRVRLSISSCSASSKPLGQVPCILRYVHLLDSWYKM